MAVATESFRTISPTCDRAVIVCADAGFFPLAYAVCSRLARLPGADYDIYLLTERNAYFDRVPQSLPFAILCPDFKPHLPPELFKKRSSEFAYMRLFAPEVLSDRYKRFLYLDCDVVVASAVSGLFGLPMRGCTIAAVDDYSLPFFTRYVSARDDEWAARHRAMGRDPATPYFNSGVLLIDAEAWRRDGITGKVIETRRGLAGITSMRDQDALNLVFSGKWLSLSPRWNFLSRFFGLGFDEILDPVVFHYAGGKPWRRFVWEGGEDYRQMFLELLVDSPFPEFLQQPIRPRDVTRYFERRWKQPLRRIFSFLPSMMQAREARATVIPRVRRQFADYLAESVAKGRFADVSAGLTNIDLAAVAEVAKSPPGYIELTRP